MAHEVKVFGRDMEVSDQVHDYVSGKAEKLDRYLKEIEETRVELSHVKSARSASDRQVAQITVRGRRLLLRTEERSDDILSAFDTALDKMQRQVERFKGKRDRGGRGDGRTAADIAPNIDLDDEEQDALVIARRKRFAIYPMMEEEALEQMKLLGHDNFFIFYNGETNAVNVLYRRRDGSYGLIEPEVA